MYLLLNERYIITNMTRINVGINPKYLTNEHLLAEHREIKRLPYSYLKAKQSGSINKIPKTFRLGTGHILFFVDKPFYTFSRYCQLHTECINRGFSVENYSDNWLNAYGSIDITVPLEYTPSEADKQLIIDRITNNIKTGKKLTYRYWGDILTQSEAILLLNGELNIGDIENSEPLLEYEEETGPFYTDEELEEKAEQAWKEYLKQ